MPFEDINGHLNVRHYIGIASEGLDESLVEVGIPQMWPLTHGQACFTAEHHVTYLDELRTGDTMSARVRLLGRSERAATRWSTCSTRRTSASRAWSRRSSCTSTSRPA